MARISGVDLPNKRVVIALTYIYGVGLSRSQEILKQLKIDENLRANDLSDSQINEINKLVENKYLIEGELRAKTNADIKRLIEINCYRGIRHRSGLPVRGQKSKTNARTRKGKSKTVANKKK